MKATIVLLFAMSTSFLGQAQRSYRAHSVLASGEWYKVAVSQTGIYKIDVGFLSKLGINTTQLSTASVRVFGNGGGMLPEACNGFKYDDLQELATWASDGGDGQLNGSDFLLFYATGPDTWTKDSAHLRFSHHKNLYSDKAYYYITIGGSRKTMGAQPVSPAANVQVTSYSGYFFHELDSVNLLNGSKDWYGEPFSGQWGSRSFPLNLLNATTGPATLLSTAVARSIGAGSRFTASVNGQTVLQQDIIPVGGGNLDLFAQSGQATAGFTAAPSLVLNYSFTAGAPNALGWLDWFEVFYRANLDMTSQKQLAFRDWNSVAPGNIAQFSVQHADGMQVWEVTDPLNPIIMKTGAASGSLVFSNAADRLREYMAFSTDAPHPEAAGKIPNQDLHAVTAAGMLIVTHPLFLAQARQIAAFHQQHDGITSVVATTDQVYNEFSSGTPDPTAIRDFAKLYYDKGNGDSASRPSYLLLLGDASFDYKNRLTNNSNLVPAYENSASLDPLSSYTSDDFFGFLNDNDDINSGLVTNLLDIGIGRVPAATVTDANAFVEKLRNYVDPQSLGAWRNQQTFVADDQDNNLHLNDAEAITAAAAAVNPLFIQDKIYLDAFTQVSTPAGSRYPDVNAAINTQIDSGTLIWNYTGHGSSTRLAEEVVLEQPVVDGWKNTWRLPLFITATCDFAPYDNPAVRSLGEDILLREKTGAIALMTTTRLVFAYSNRIINRNYLQTALQQRADGSYLRLGDAVRLAKNFTYQTQVDISNNRKFTLLGDPALTLAFPKYRVQTVSINGNATGNVPDTLKALQHYSIKGNIQDAQGGIQTGFNGTLHADVFDKPRTISTKANDPDSYVQAFQVNGSRIFSGTVAVSAGVFTLEFVVPKDINYQPGNGRINYYADNGQTDAGGDFRGFIVGGSAGNSTDTAGPQIKAWLNDTRFTNGAVVSPDNILFVQLADSSGINTMGTGIGHDMTAVLDSNFAEPYVLTGYFVFDTGSYQSGGLSYLLPQLADGPHTLTIRAWDGANNSRELVLRFVVKRHDFAVTSLVNYPNPMTNQTTFRFQHNRPNTYLQVSIKIYSLSGAAVKTINTTINTALNRSSEVPWNGASDSGVPLQHGVYIYRLQLTSAGAGGETAFKAGKLIVL